MSEFKIEKGVPVASDGRRRNKYPFAEMDVGDSFFIDNVQLRDSTYESVSVSARGYGYRHNKKFKQRIENNGVRIWRIA